ncbi:disease resistance protein RPV1-like [Malus domestica]|uniref:disease resistance protein RPV1-like n=1 Tax=Malus domestica TaxID=3750 RepID=UPI00397704E8
MAASSSFGRQWKHDVFINFRGEDTRKGFVSHLYRALRQKPINTFIDAQELRKGDRLSELLTAIRESRLSIVVFSQNYASSTWCLKELVEILECKDTKNQIVLPIFYEVDPSDVRKLKGRFAEAFAQHDHDFNAEMEEVQSWRSALTIATSLSGWDSRNYEEDAKLIEEIVEDVFRKLRHISSTPCKDNDLVEMDSHVHEMHLRLHPDPPGVELDDVRIVGIWGMGGLGKTTIARAVYNKTACQFEACCFLENVKEGFMKHGELHMQTQLLSSISGNKVGSSDISKNGFQVMLKNLGHKKLLVVVDDVDKLAQIEALLGKEHSFGGGSRIIITTRDVQLLSGANAIYSPKVFNDAGALELFRRYAFRTKQSTKDYDNLSRRVIQYAQGLPLALKVLGAFLDNKTIREWKDVLEKIRKIPQREIHDVLKTSYDGLDDTEKDIFLDIACFFKGMQKNYAIEIMDGCGFYPHSGIRVLIDRALINVWRGKLEMHDSLQEMGREIVRQESIKEPGRRSRLWSYGDVHHVLTQNTGTEAVESIILDLSISDEVCLNAEAFDRMTQLRLLRMSHSYDKQHLIGHLKFLSRELRCLYWHGSPLKSLPSNFQFKNLVDLDMQYSRIERLWEGTQTMGKLKFINLSYCEYLKETPDFTKVPNLERLIFVGCISLVEVHPSISTLTNLVLLDLRGCNELMILANSIRMKYLKTLDLSGCSSLEMFPEILEVMEELLVLNLFGSKIKELPSSINNLTGLRDLKLTNCKELKSLSSIRMKSLVTLDLSGCSSLTNLVLLDLYGSSKLKSLSSSIRMKSLKILDLSGCSSLEMFPEILEVMEELQTLDISGSKIKELPSSINNLTGLRYLNLKDCKELKSLPSIIHMRSLITLDLSGCSSLEMFPEILEVMEELQTLDISGSKIKELPSSINNLTGLRYLNLKDCKELKSLPSIIHMRSLITLDLSGCSSLEMFPEILEVMEELPELNLSESKIKELPSSINNLTGLRYLKLTNCKELKNLPGIRMKSLKILDLSGCSSLEMFPEILEVMEELPELNLSGLKIEELPSSINNLTGLRYLKLTNCKELKSLPSIRMKSLVTLDLSGCSSLEMFPEILEVMEELQKLNLFGSKIKELPSSINNLTGLRYLDLKDCKELKSLPSFIHMRSLAALNLYGCSSLAMFPEILEVMEQLIGLDLSGSKIKELPSSINCLTGLRILILKDCKELKTLPSSICQLQSLYYLSLSGCTKFEVFPNIEENMEELRALHLDGTSIKELPPSIERLQQLVLLNLGKCESLVHLPDTFCNLARPLAVNLSGCTNLSQFPVDYEDLARLWDYQVDIGRGVLNLTRILLS